MGTVTAAQAQSEVWDVVVVGTGMGGSGQHIPAESMAGIVPVEQATERPVWMARNEEEGSP